MRFLFLSILAFFFHTPILICQEVNNQQLEFSIRIPELAVNTLNMGIEYISTERFSTGIDLGVQVSSSPNLARGSISDVDFYAFIEGKFYLAPRHGADRLYLSTFGQYEFDKSNAPFDQSKIENRVTFGGLLGYKFVHKTGFLIDFSLGTGLGKRYFRLKNDLGEIYSEYNEISDFSFLIHLNVGYRFNL